MQNKSSSVKPADATGNINYNQQRDDAIITVGGFFAIFAILLVGLQSIFVSWQKAFLLMLALAIAIAMGAAIAHSRKNRIHAIASFAAVLMCMAVFGYCTANI